MGRRGGFMSLTIPNVGPLVGRGPHAIASHLALIYAHVRVTPVFHGLPFCIHGRLIDFSLE